MNFDCDKIIYNKNNCNSKKIESMFGKSKFSLSQYRCPSIAVVGSSSKLLEKEYGKEIDDHDYIIRFNGARFLGFEKHVGSRTDIRFNGTIRSFKENDEIRIQRYNNKKYMDRSFLRHKNKDPKSGPKEDYYERWVKNNYATSCQFNEYVKSLNKGSSMGFVGVIVALCLAEKVHLYGFWNPRTDKNKRYHYFEDKLKDVTGTASGHNFDRERIFYERYSANNPKKLIIND